MHINNCEFTWKLFIQFVKVLLLTMCLVTGVLCLPGRRYTNNGASEISQNGKRVIHTEPKEGVQNFCQSNFALAMHFIA